MTTTRRSSQCLDDETIAAFVDGGLDRDARDRVEQHAASCTDCYAILVTVAGALPMLPHALKSTRSTVVGRRHLWLWIGATAAAAAVVSALWLGYRRPPSARPELAALVSAVGRERPVESRLTGGFAWAPFDAGVRGDSTVRPPPDVRIAAARIEQALAGQRSAVNVAAFGTSLLVLGDVNGAVTALEEATRLDRGRAAYWSDLGAAYLASAGRSGGDVNLPRALEAVETALSIAPTLAEARFNRAVILERFGLRERAIDAWEAYLAIDASSPWRAEANQRLQELRARSLPPQGDRDLQPARRRLYRELLSDWVDAVQRGASGRDSIAAMRVVVSEIDEQAVDPMAHGVVAALAEAETATQARRRAVADAYATFLRSQAALDAEAFDVALASSSAARVRLGALGSPLALSARFNEAVVAYRRGEALHARHLLAGIREEVRARAYAPLLGRVDWMLGLIEALQGRRGRAAQYYESALAAFKAASENANVASVEGLAAANYDNIGDPIRGWTFRLDALRGNRHPGVLLSASLSALRLGWPRAALVLSDFALDTARATNSPANVADALRIEAAIASELGISSTARRFIDEAKAFVAGRSEPAWERVNAEIALAEARASTTTAAAGIGAAGTAIAYFTKTGARGRLPELYEIRARLYAQLGDRARAKADVLAGLDSLEHQRRDIPPGVDQVMFEAVERALVGELLALAASDEDSDVAFSRVDARRGRDMAPDTSSRMSLRQLQAAMPPRVVLIEYAVSDTVSHAWIVTPHSRTFSSIPAGRQELAQLVLAATPPQADSGARAHLSRLLLEDAMPALAASDELVVIPDGPLVALPFGFLAGRDDRPLAGHLSIVLTPSAQSWRQATIRLAAHHRSSTSLLAIGNPRLDARVYPVLPDLPQADAEIAAVATHYAAPRLLLRGPSATVDAVVRGLATADVVHVAAHAVMNPWLTDASYIALAGPESPTLTASRVRTLGRLPARLVVLAACESGAGGRALFDSPLSLARAFLAAGVPAVVASLWPVSDRASRALFDVFHTEFSRSGDAARALQRAQVALMGSTDSSLSDARQWAGFVAMGGSAMKGTSGGGME